MGLGLKPYGVPRWETPPRTAWTADTRFSKKRVNIYGKVRRFFYRKGGPARSLSTAVCARIKIKVCGVPAHARYFISARARGSCHFCA